MWIVRAELTPMAGEFVSCQPGPVHVPNRPFIAPIHPLHATLRLPCLGTTFLLVDPTVSADDLCNAVERHWWPALEDPMMRFSVRITRPDGEDLYPRPRQDPVLRSFISTYERATVSSNVSETNFARIELGKVESGDVVFQHPGVLSLAADLQGWSYPNETGVGGNLDIEHRSLVALMRKPRMVVEYYDVGRTPPFVRGAFVADDVIDHVLRGTEPPRHDKWQTRPSADLDVHAAKIADVLMKRVKSHVGKFRTRIKPEPRPQEQLRLPEFDRIMRRLLHGTEPGTSPPQPTKRDVNIGVPMLEVIEVTSKLVRVTGRAKFALSEHFRGDSAKVEIRIRYLLEEDGRATDSVPLTVDSPPGFTDTNQPGVSKGILVQGCSVAFKFDTVEYPAMWSGRMYVEANLISGGTE